ncbi:MAG: protease [Ferruginibacter sp.]|nr:protease [Ferruginibacter sp.]
MIKKILFITGDFTEDYETMVPFQVLEMVGHTVHTVCPGKKKGDKVFTAVHDFLDAQTYHEFPGHKFELNYNFDDVHPEEYDALCLPGGRAPEYLRLNSKVLEYAKHFADADKPIAAICHGIQILTAADTVRGKRLTAYYSVGPEVTIAGGTYVNVAANEAVVDGNLVTSPAWPGNSKWMKEFLKVLGTTIVP